MASTQSSAQVGGYASRTTTLTNVRIFDGRKLLEAGSVVIDGAVISHVTAGADAGPSADGEVLDGKGGVLLPGLIDAHIHLKDTSTLEKLAAHGVTTALDMGTWPASLVDSLRAQTGAVTDIRSSGVGASSPASAHGNRPGRPADGLVAGPDDAEKYVADRLAEGVDYIKIVIDLPGFDQATLDALVAAARRQGKQTITHASTLQAVRMAQAAKADMVTHVPLNQPFDKADTETMLDDGRVLIPTLAMMQAIVEKVGRPGAGPSYEAARASVAAAYLAGVPILAGTDANEAAGVPASPPFGESLHHELELLVDAGLSTVDALRAATSLPARHFGLDDRGVIAAGKRADLVLLSGDPIADIRATRTIERIWCAGNAITITRQG